MVQPIQIKRQFHMNFIWIIMGFDAPKHMHIPMCLMELLWDFIRLLLATGLIGPLGDLVKPISLLQVNRTSQSEQQLKLHQQNAAVDCLCWGCNGCYPEKEDTTDTSPILLGSSDGYVPK